MRIFILSIIALCLLFLGCNDSESEAQRKIPEEYLSPNCTKGKIVGEKCGIYALQIILTRQDFLKPQDWGQKPSTGGEVTIYKNVIGLINLPDSLKSESKILFMTIRQPTEDENKFPPCYLDIPGPPEPFYVITYVNESKCGN